MDCQVTMEALVDFHFGQIPAGRRTEVEAHLASCPTCLASYFELKRDLEAPVSDAKPSELTRARIHKDFAAYCEELLAERNLGWLASSRVRLSLGLVAVAAALLLILYSGQLRWARNDSHPQPKAPVSEELRSLDEAVDSGRLSPGHINMI